jgi:hypothetical protein
MPSPWYKNRKVTRGRLRKLKQPMAAIAASGVTTYSLAKLGVTQIKSKNQPTPGNESRTNLETSWSGLVQAFFGYMYLGKH